MIIRLLLSTNKHVLDFKGDVKKWWIWGYWSSPLMYAMNGIVVNEMLGNKWKMVSRRKHSLCLSGYLDSHVKVKLMFIIFIYRCYSYWTVPRSGKQLSQMEGSMQKIIGTGFPLWPWSDSFLSSTCVMLCLSLC